MGGGWRSRGEREQEMVCMGTWWPLWPTLYIRQSQKSKAEQSRAEQPLNYIFKTHHALVTLIRTQTCPLPCFLRTVDWLEMVKASVRGARELDSPIFSFRDKRMSSLPFFCNLGGKDLPLPSRLRSVAGCTEMMVDVLLFLALSSGDGEPFK